MWWALWTIYSLWSTCLPPASAVSGFGLVFCHFEGLGFALLVSSNGHGFTPGQGGLRTRRTQPLSAHEVPHLQMSCLLGRALTREFEGSLALMGSRRAHCLHWATTSLVQLCGGFQVLVRCRCLGAGQPHKPQLHGKQCLWFVGAICCCQRELLVVDLCLHVVDETCFGCEAGGLYHRAARRAGFGTALAHGAGEGLGLAQCWCGGGLGVLGRQKAAIRPNMRREERVTVQGPVKEQQPDGMSHRAAWRVGQPVTRVAASPTFACLWQDGWRSSVTAAGTGEYPQTQL